MSDDVVTAALARLASVIGDREGLADLGQLFRELDEDGSGELDIDEFTQALRRFGIAESDDCIAKMFKVIDADGGGTLDFDEFSAVAKNELELATLNVELVGVDVGQEGRVAAEAAVKSGVRLNRTQSTMLDKKMQGDLEMLTAEAVEQRRCLKEDPKLREAVQGWWDGVAKEHCMQMDKDAYIIFSVSLHKHFVPDVTDEEALVAALDDWKEDCPAGQDVMRFGKILLWASTFVALFFVD
jgi:hypothetical protein